MNPNGKVRVVWTKQRTIALSLVIAAMIALSASASLVATHQAQAFWGHGGFGHGFGFRGGWGGWGGWGFPGWGWGGGCGGCCGGCGWGW
jgi:Spy/CpxP family protein refolding chaperone